VESLQTVGQYARIFTKVPRDGELSPWRDCVRQRQAETVPLGALTGSV